MTQEKGIPYQRHKPSAALREFLDPLDPGSYFDCGLARLRGLDDALLAEAKSRGRQIGDDSFQLVATDMGVIYCRPSISFAIAARWNEVTIVRPQGDDPAVLAISWPTHGELKFTVSKRLGGNIFRRWLQLRIKADRTNRSGVGHDEQSEERDRSVSVSSEKARSVPRATEVAAPAPTADARDEQQIQGVDRVAAKVAEAAAIVGGGRPTEADRTPRPRTRRRDLSAEVDGSETWEVVSKVSPPRVKASDRVSSSKKVDRRQSPEDVLRKRQARAERIKRRRGGGGEDRSRPPARTRWFDLDPSDPTEVVPIYDVPPLPPAPIDDRPAAVSAVTSEDPPEVPSEPETEGEPTEPVESPESACNPAPEDPEAADTAAGPQETEPLESVGDPATAEERTPVEPAVGVPGPPSRPAFAELATLPKPPAPPKRPTVPRPPSAPTPRTRPRPIDRSPAKPRAAVTGDHEPTDRPLPSVLAIDPPTPQPSWIGSPGSLVAAMVVISTFVLIAAVAVGSYRRTTTLSVEADPAGPSVSTIDHQRFRPTVDGERNEPTASELGRPESGRYSETTAPPSTTGSGSAPLTSMPEWPPEDGPQTCNSNYSGCVPDVGDVDCPEDGDGPIFWPESAMVMGEDVYELDTDGDGEICEPDQPRLADGLTAADVQVSSESGG